MDILSRRVVEIKKGKRADQPSLKTCSWKLPHDASAYIHCAELDNVAVLIVRDIGKFMPS